MSVVVSPSSLRSPPLPSTIPCRKPLTEEEMLSILEEYEDLDNVETVNGPGDEECEELLDSCSDEETVHEHAAKKFGRK